MSESGTLTIISGGTLVVGLADALTAGARGPLLQED